PPAPPVMPPTRNRAALPSLAIFFLVILTVGVALTTHFFPFFIFPAVFFLWVRGRRGWGPGYRGRRSYRM
uniref:hypothetical protein n=1 Tax=Nocardia alni TaxID=2815723 RepID=UPI001C2188A3